MPNFRNNVSFYKTENDCGCERSREASREMNRRREDSIPERCHMEDSISHMPLAMAYVPWQRWQNILDADKGFQCGTIFHDLVKPFEHAGGGCR